MLSYIAYSLIYRSDVEQIVDEIVKKEPLISASKVDQVRRLILREFASFTFTGIYAVISGLQEKLSMTKGHRFYLFKVCKAHLLPLTNCCFDKAGTR